MSEQNYKNHSRLSPVFHFGVYPLAAFALTASIIKFYRSYTTGYTGLLVPVTLIALSLALIVLATCARSFGLKAQDRAIRAEENLRYFAITGKLLDSKLTLKQIIALRFAPNNELVDLAHRAVTESLSASDIKKAILHWKADEHRV